LNELFAPMVPFDEIIALLRPVLSAYAAERSTGETFGDWCHRSGIAQLNERFALVTA